MSGAPNNGNGCKVCIVLQCMIKLFMKVILFIRITCFAFGQECE